MGYGIGLQRWKEGRPLFVAEARRRAQHRVDEPGGARARRGAKPLDRLVHGGVVGDTGLAQLVEAQPKPEEDGPVQALERAVHQVPELGIEAGAQADGAVGQLQRQTSLQGGHARQPSVGRAVGVRPLFDVLQDAEGGDAR